jgi:hypothetical protein
MKKRLYFLYVIILVLISSCNVSIDKPKKIMDNYYFSLNENISDQNSTYIDVFYSNLFFENTSKDDWILMRSKIFLKTGEYISHELKSWNVRTFAGIGKSGTYYNFLYVVKYKNGEVNESIILYKPNNSKNIKIIGHNFNSNLFL